MALPTLVLLAVSVLSVLYWLVLPRALPGIPYHRKSRRNILGDLPRLLDYVKKTSDPFEWFSLQCVELESPIVQVWIKPLGPAVVVLSDFREVEDIVLRRTKEFDRAPFMKAVLKGTGPYHSIRMSTDETFKAQRKIFMDTMSPAFLHEVAAPQIYSATVDLVQLWRLKASLAKGHPFQADVDIIHAALDAIWAVTVGGSVGTTKTQVDHLTPINSLDLAKDKDEAVKMPKGPVPIFFSALTTITAALETMTSSPSPVLHHFILRQFPKLRRAFALKDKSIESMLKQARAQFLDQEHDKPAKSAMDHVLRREVGAAEKNGYHISDAALKDELFGFLIAGHETTATILCWAAKYLGDYQHVQTTLRDALLKTHTQTPSADDIMRASIPYLDAFIEEALRCSRTATGITRVATVDTEILGHRIPKGTEVFCMNNGPSFLQPSLPVDESARSSSSRAAKSRTGEWNDDDVSDFAPERWLSSDENGKSAFNPKAGPNLPFSAGIRGCFGKKLAYAELRIILTLLVLNFEMQHVPSELGGYAARQKLTRTPQQCYVRLRSLS